MVETAFTFSDDQAEAWEAVSSLLNKAGVDMLAGTTLPPTEEWTPAQRDNEVSKAALEAGVHPTRVRRLGIFMDGAGFTK